MPGSNLLRSSIAPRRGHAVGYRILNVNRRVTPWQHCRAFPAPYDIQPARNSAELRSVASLRAAIFFDFASATCSEYAAQAHVRMRADSMWEYLEDAYAEQDPHKKDRLVCFYASIEDNHYDSTAKAMRQIMDLSCTLPADGVASPRIIIGALDLTVGPRIGSEHLAGKLPQGEAAQRRRAYLSNVSVAPAARRRGVAAALIAAAYRHASQMGIQHLYVHAATDNEGAVHLYGQHCGFEVEQEETVELARNLNRPRRLLFHKTILPLGCLD